MANSWEIDLEPVRPKTEVQNDKSTGISSVVRFCIRSFLTFFCS